MIFFCLIILLLLSAYIFIKFKKPESFRNIKPDISIDKYILKSKILPESVKFSDDQYILKTSISPSIEHIDRNKYILKSEIPSCPSVDLSKYVLKSTFKSDQSSIETPIVQSDTIDTNQPDLNYGLDAYDSTDNLAELEEQDNNLHKYVKSCNTNEWNMNKNYAY